MEEVINSKLLVDVLGINEHFTLKHLETRAGNLEFEYHTIHDNCYSHDGCYNTHELAIKIVDKMITLGYVASLTKIKEHWWCEFATENYYKNNGIMSHGSGDGSRDIDTKSDDVLSCAVKAYGWILENKGSK